MKKLEISKQFDSTNTSIDFKAPVTTETSKMVIEDMGFVQK